MHGSDKSLTSPLSSRSKLSSKSGTVLANAVLAKWLFIVSNDRETLSHCSWPAVGGAGHVRPWLATSTMTWTSLTGSNQMKPTFGPYRPGIQISWFQTRWLCSKGTKRISKRSQPGWGGNYVSKPGPCHPSTKQIRSFRKLANTAGGNHYSYHKSHASCNQYTTTSTENAVNTTTHRPDRRWNKMCDFIYARRGETQFQKPCDSSDRCHHSGMRMSVDMNASSAMISASSWSRWTKTLRHNWELRFS